MTDPARGGRELISTPGTGTAPRVVTGAGPRLGDLHDAIIQTLFGVGLTLQAAAATAGEDRLAARLEEVAGHLASVVRDRRDYAARSPGRLEVVEIVCAVLPETAKTAAGGPIVVRRRSLNHRDLIPAPSAYPGPGEHPAELRIALNLPNLYALLEAASRADGDSMRSGVGEPSIPRRRRQGDS